MNCKQMESCLMDYLDGNLAARERQAVELHAESCASCADRLHGFTEVSRILDSWKGIEPTAAFNARLDERLEQEAYARLWRGGLFPRLAPLPLGNPVFALALLVVVSLAAVLIRYSPVPPPQLARRQPAPIVASMGTGVDDLALYRDLPVLEDLDVLRNFEVLQELNSSNPSHQ